jgi:hypothetical protein
MNGGIDLKQNGLEAGQSQPTRQYTTETIENALLWEIYCEELET